MTRICSKTELNEKVHSSVFLAFLHFVKSKFLLLSNGATWAENTHFSEIVLKLENTIMFFSYFKIYTICKYFAYHKDISRRYLFQLIATGNAPNSKF